MVRQSRDSPCSDCNGFTVLEMMIVLLIVSLLTVISISITPLPLTVFMKELENKIVQEQIRAYAENADRELEITGKSLRTPDTEYFFPSNIACTPYAWHYTKAGTISVGGTVTCTNDSQSKQLVFRIGASRIVIR